jgi:membrane-associated phospholipid phosphatase
MGAVAVGMGTAYLIMDAQTKPLSFAEIQALDRNNVSAFDRDATYHWSKPIKTTSDIFLYTSMGVPSLLFIDKKIQKDYLQVGTIWAQTFALNAAVTSLTKVLVKRPRPLLYNKNVPAHYQEDRDSRYSFFSGHTSVSAAMYFMTAKIYHDYNPNSKAIPWIWIGAATVPAIIGILRNQTGKHFWTDIITGYVVGAAIGILVPELHKIRF